MPQINTNERTRTCEEKKVCEDIHIEKKNQNSDIKGFFKNLETDDIILIAIAFLLLADDCDDKILLLAIGFIFISGIL